MSSQCSRRATRPPRTGTPGLIRPDARMTPMWGQGTRREGRTRSCGTRRSSFCWLRAHCPQDRKHLKISFEILLLIFLTRRRRIYTIQNLPMREKRGAGPDRHIRPGSAEFFLGEISYETSWKPRVLRVKAPGSVITTISSPPARRTTPEGTSSRRRTPRPGPSTRRGLPRRTRPRSTP